MFLFDVLCWMPSKSETRLINKYRGLQNKLKNLQLATDKMIRNCDTHPDFAPFKIMVDKRNAAMDELFQFKRDHSSVYSWYLSGNNAYHSRKSQKFPSDFLSKRQKRELKIEDILSNTKYSNVIFKVVTELYERTKVFLQLKAA